jgi:hypothetical protein
MIKRRPRVSRWKVIVCPLLAHSYPVGVCWCFKDEIAKLSNDTI